LDHLRQFDLEYCCAVKNACLGAIAGTSYAENRHEDRPIPAEEIKIALIDIIGTITAMAEQSLPNDMQRWADDVAAKFAASFHAARSLLTAEDLDLLQNCKSRS
jgi:hypothetical protein